MAGFVKIEISDSEIDRMFADLPAVAKRATANTLNKVIRIVNKNVRKFITDNYNIPKKAIKIAGGLVSFKRADARRDIGTATIFIRKVGRGLFKYGAIESGNRVLVTVKKTPKRVRGAFVSIWRKGETNKFVFRKAIGKNAGTITRRTKTGKSYQAAKREVLFGPKIADLYVSRRAGGIVDKTIDKEYQVLLDKEFNRQFERRR